jgi:CBS domain containing-hemolysin-like protein
VIELFLTLLGLLILLLLDLALIAARSSMLATSNARLLALRDEMGVRVSRTTALLGRLSRLKPSLDISLILTRFGLVGLVVLIQGIWVDGLATWAVVLVVLLAALVLFWLEWAVDTTVARNPEYWALRLSTFARVVMGVMVIFLLPLKISGDEQESFEATSIVTEDEVRTLVDAGEEEGVFEQDERRMIFSIFQLGDTLAREIMVPRIDMLSLEVTTPLPDAVDALLESGYSRVPVFEESIDNTLGLLYAKDLLKVWREGSELDSMRELLRRVFFVPEAKKVDELLTEMQSQRVHMSIVVDEYGGVAGLVTLEDIVEEILGEIQDEYDEGEEAPYQKLESGEYLFMGRIDLDDFNEIMGSELPGDDADTLGGFIYSRLGRVPTVGDKVQADQLLLVVEQVSARRIRKVRALWKSQDEQVNKDVRSVVG